MATNFTGSVYNEATNGDLRTSTQTPVWAFGTSTTVRGTLGPFDSSGLFSNTWQDSIAVDTTLNSGSGDPQHPRAFVPGQTYQIRFVFHDFERVDLKIEADTAVLNTYQYNNGSQQTLDYTLTAGSRGFYNFCLNGWGRDGSGNLASVNYEVYIGHLEQ